MRGTQSGAGGAMGGGGGGGTACEGRDGQKCKEEGGNLVFVSLP